MINWRHTAKLGVQDHLQLQIYLVEGHMIVNRNMSKIMDNILKNYEVQVLCVPATDIMIRR